MKARFQSQDPKYSLKYNQLYDIDFRSENGAVFVEVYDRGDYVSTVVFNDANIFIESWVFDGHKVVRGRQRKFTDYETTRFFSAGEVADYVGVHKNTVFKWVKDGRLRLSHRILPRGDMRFTREDVLELIAGMKGGEF